MKKTKIIVPALGMLLLSTAASVTGTVAWFSANTQVTANGLQVKAKSNQTFLLIAETVSGDNNAAKAASIQALNDGAGQTAVGFTIADPEVYPAKPKEASEVKAAEGAVEQSDVNSGKYFAYQTAVVADQTTAAVAANWYTAVNNDPSSSTNSLNPSSFVSLNTTTDDPYEFSKYVIKKTVYLTLSAGSVNAHNLSVSGSFTVSTGETASVITATRVLLASGSNLITLDPAHTSGSLHETVDTTLNSISVVQVDAYIYVDGSDAVVYSNNMANLAGATVNLTFSVEVGTGA